MEENGTSDDRVVLLQGRGTTGSSAGPIKPEPSYGNIKWKSFLETLVLKV